MKKTYIIAEAGVNHNGDFSIARKMVLEAKKAGADAVKFQTFVSKNLVSSFAPKAEYQKKSTDASESQLDMLKKLELSFDQFTDLKKYADEVGIDFLSTPFDEDSIDFLSTLHMKYWKIPSGEITNLPYLVKIERTKLPIIMSTGMCTMEEIEAALSIFRSYVHEDIILLHCNTEYPTPYHDVNLAAMKTLQDYFHVRTGYSDHTQGIEAAIAAAALGAAVIEKHFTLDRNMTGPDHKSSLSVNEFSEMVTAIRHTDEAIGDCSKRPTESEKKNIVAARKSIVARINIKKGETFTEQNITAKRPGDGISPMKWFEILGKTAERDFETDEKIRLD